MTTTALLLGSEMARKPPPPVLVVVVVSAPLVLARYGGHTVDCAADVLALRWLRSPIPCTLVHILRNHNTRKGPVVILGAVELYI